MIGGLCRSVEGAKRRAPGNGLRQYALRVMTKVEQKRWTTYNEIADELVREVAYDYTSRSMSPQVMSLSVCLSVCLLLGVAVWCSGNALVSINAVALHRARLVLGWVTAFGQVNCLTT